MGIRRRRRLVDGSFVDVLLGLEVDRVEFERDETRRGRVVRKRLAVERFRLVMDPGDELLSVVDVDRVELDAGRTEHEADQRVEHRMRHNARVQC